MGGYCRAGFASDFCTNMEDFGWAWPTDPYAHEKIFRFFEIFICIWGKMGYNNKKPFDTARNAQRENQ